MYKLGIVGIGSMGSAIVNGILDAKILEPSQIVIYNPKDKNLDEFAQKGVYIARDNKELGNLSKSILLAVVPQLLEEVSKEMGFIQDKLIMSIAAGVELSRLKNIFGRNRYVRIMPNTPLLINKGMTAIVKDETTTDEDLDFVLEVFDSMGKTALIQEDLIDPFMAVTGCMPAYVYKFIESAADGAVALGLSRAEAYQYIAQSVAGAANMILETGIHPGVLKDQVTSPGGSTIQGVLALDENGFGNSIIKAVLASSKLDI